MTRSGSTAFQQIELTIARILFKERPQSGHHFADGLGEFSLMRVALLNAGENFPEYTPDP